MAIRIIYRHGLSYCHLSISSCSLDGDEVRSGGGVPVRRRTVAPISAFGGGGVHPLAEGGGFAPRLPSGARGVPVRRRTVAPISAFGGGGVP